MGNHVLETQNLATTTSPFRPRQHSLDGHRHEIQQDVQALATALREAVEDAQQHIVDEMKRNPYVTLAVAAGIGYVLSGGLSARATRIVISVGSRLAIAVAARELAVRLEGAHATGG